MDFLIDADERVTPDLAKELQEAASGSRCAYFVQRHNAFRHIHATHGILRPDWVCRMVPKMAVKVYGRVHEEIRVNCEKNASAVQVSRTTPTGVGSFISISSIRTPNFRQKSILKRGGTFPS